MRPNDSWNLCYICSHLNITAICGCVCPARPEENGVEAAPVDKGSDRGRRVRGARGECTNIKADFRCKIWMFLMYVNVTQDLEVEAEAEHQQGVGSQPREWGINTHTERGKTCSLSTSLLSLVSLVVAILVYIQWAICISLTFSQDLQSCRLSIGGWDRGRTN